MLTGMAALGLTLTACGGGPAGGGGPVEDVVIDTSQVSGEIDYWLWDSNQLPAYQQCADAFKQANPNATVTISQIGWPDYWSRLTNGFVAGDAPDVFTNHLSKYPEIVTNYQLAPLDATLANDGFDVNQYQPGLAHLWKGQDGKRYGLPKDFDTVAIFYNKKLTDEAGLTAEQLNRLSWNPQDGGSYERAIAHLTVDENGVRGDELGFDKENVAVYGLGLDGSAGSGVGQDPMEHVHRFQQLDLHRQEPVGHPLQLRPAPVPGDHRLVLRLDRQGLHAVSGRRHRAGQLRHLLGGPVRDGDQRLVDD